MINNSNRKIKHEIVIEELTWQPSKEKKNILDHINFCFEDENFYGIIGPNGSGKTSLVKHLLRFREVKSGKIELDETNLKDYNRQELAKKIALVPQNTMMDFAFQAYDIVMMGRSPYQKRFADASEADQKLVMEAMKLTDCYDMKEKEVSLLSGGEAQRVITARAIAQDTKWLILDEPTSSLDVKHQIELMEALVKLKERKSKTIIAVLHDINIAARYCNKIIMMKDGKIHSHGNTEEVLTKENLYEVYGIQFELLEASKTGKIYYIPCGS
ncbi:MAG: transporter [Herbinix sp.]|jgi:iron complex transport system ATP-binding protein|nr:transporter [Herbinix sp.]